MPGEAIVIFIFIASFMYALARPKSVTQALLFIVVLTIISFGAMSLPPDFVVNLFK